MVKPSEQTPLTLLRFVELAEGIVPPGVLNVITGDGVPAGEALVKNTDVRLALTGDVATGRIIAATAADSLKRVHLELGGKAPVIVFDDADPAAVAEGIKIAGYWNLGAGLALPPRGSSPAPRSTTSSWRSLVPAVESIKVGDPAEGEDIEMGSVISMISRTACSSSTAPRARPSSRAAARTAIAASS